MANLIPSDNEESANLSSAVRNAKRFSLILFLVSMVTAPLVATLADRNDASLAVLVPLAVGGMLTLVSFQLAHTRQATLAAYVLIAANLMIGVVMVSILSGAGLIWTLNSFLVSVLVAVRVLPRPKLGRTVFVIAVVTIGILLWDMLVPWPRVPLQDRGQWLVLLLGAGLLGLLLLWEAPSFPNYSLRAKFVIGNILVVVLTVLGLTVHINRSTRAALAETTGNNLNSVAETQARFLGELLSFQIGVLESLSFNEGLHVELAAANDALDSRDPAEIEAEWATANADDPIVQSRLNNALTRELLEFRSRFPTHTELIITDRTGRLAAATNRPDRYSYSDEGWWQAAYNIGLGSTYVSAPIYDPDRNTFSINIAVPVHANDSQTAVGVLASTYSLRELRALLAAAEEELGETSQLDLLLPSAEIISFEDAAVKVVEPDVLANIVAIPEQGFDTFEMEGESSMVSWARVSTPMITPHIDALNWRVVVHDTEEASQVLLQNQQRNFILYGLVAVILSAAIAALVSQTLTRPLVRLRDTAEEVAEGNLSARAKVESGDEVGALATSFNTMTSELQKTVLSQERKVAERTQALAVSLQVSRRLSTILDERQLVAEVVRQVQRAFDYYHVQIYLLDEAEEYLVMAGGTGDTGQVLLASGHRLAKGQGLVGQAADSNQAILVPDVSLNVAWAPNPLLPYTKAELAVPIALGDQVLGVLDVQHSVQKGLDHEDTDFLLTVASQVAVALRNARSYEEARRQAEREAIINTINRRIQNTTSVDSAMQVAIRELGRALGADHTTIKLKETPLSPSNGRLESEPNQDAR